MLGFGRGISLGLAGWLWADLLLGLFAIFLAANTTAPPPEALARSGIDPQPVLMRVAVSGFALLGADADAVVAEQRRFTQDVQNRLAAIAPGRRVAIVFAYGVHQSPSEGDRIAALATALLREGPFAGAAIKAYHELTPGDIGRSVALEIYLYE